VNVQRRPPRVELIGSLPAPLVVALSGQAHVATVDYSFADFGGCPTVPVGCLPFDRGEARDLVVRWSQWANSRYSDAASAWETLCAPLAGKASHPGAVQFGFWESVWSKWPEGTSEALSWQVAFKFMDQCAGTGEDGGVDRADFGVAFRLAAVAAGVSAWCQKLRAAHGSPNAAWMAVGAAESPHGGITYSAWESQAWRGQEGPAEESFAYVDRDGDNVVAWREFSEAYQSCGAQGSASSQGPQMSPASPSAALPPAAPAAGARCFAFRPEEFGDGEPNAFGDIVAQRWSLFLLDAFDSQDAFTWEMSTGGVSWSDGHVRFSGGGRSLRTMAALYRNTGTILITAELTKVGLCDNHFVMLSTSAAESWSWRPSLSSVKFAWNCGSKYILSRTASASTGCPRLGRYTLSITLDPAGAMEFQDDRGCKDLVLLDSLGANGEPLYLYIGGDGPPGTSSIFGEISVKIGINSLHGSDAAFPTATACLYDGAQYEDTPTGRGRGRTTEPSLAECQHRCSSTPGCAHFSFQLWSHGCDLFDSGARWHRTPGVVSGPPHCIVGVQMRVSGVGPVQLSSFQRDILAPRLASELASAADVPRGAVKDAAGTAELVSLNKGEMLACGFVNLPAGHSFAGIATRLARGALEERVRASLARVGISGMLRNGLHEQLHLDTAAWALPAAQCLLLGTAFAPRMPGRDPLRADNASACQRQCVGAQGCRRFTFHRKSSTCHLHNASATASWDADAIAGPRVCATLPSVLEARPGLAARDGAGGSSSSAAFWWIFGLLMLLFFVLAAFGLGLLALQHLGGDLPKYLHLVQGTAREGSGMYRPLSAEDEVVHREDAKVANPPAGLPEEQRTEPAENGTHECEIPRKARISMVFQALDTRQKGRLGLEELRRYADFCGFDGTDVEWVEEYKLMCRENGWEDTGMTLHQFHRLVQDESGKGFCTDDELTGLLEELQSSLPSGR